MLKFGLDWSWVDLNYSKYTISESEEPGSGSVGDIMQMKRSTSAIISWNTACRSVLRLRSTRFTN